MGEDVRSERGEFLDLVNQIPGASAARLEWDDEDDNSRPPQLTAVVDLRKLGNDNFNLELDELVQAIQAHIDARGQLWRKTRN